jgi:glucose-1-phosphate cytidylyltransferase
MKVILLSGGFGTRISEESHIRPKPMVEIGGQPILWHIMKHYYAHGFDEFIVCAGYKQNIIKEYFGSYHLYGADILFDFSKPGEIIVRNSSTENWKVMVADTGLKTMTGGRIRRVREYIGNEPFMLTYGDGLSDVDIPALLDFHRKNGKLLTLTAVQPAGRFGVLDIDENNNIKRFAEKSKQDVGWINGGFMVVEPAVLDYIEGDQTVWEREPLERLSAEGQLAAYKHSGFWRPMDTLKDKNELTALWTSLKAPWALWNKTIV